MIKPFLTIEEQIALLNSRGLETDKDTARVLMCESYYSIINGYKDFFIDKKLSAKKGEDVYLPGSKFSEIYDLFVFDRYLREVSFHYLTRAEAAFKTIAVYTFCEAYQEPNSYLSRENYTDPSNYMLGKNRCEKDISELMGTLNYKAYESRNCSAYIKHYREYYDAIPLWVLANELTFGNMSYFFNAQKRKIQSRICQRILENNPTAGTSGGYLAPNDMRLMLRHLVEFRNICAHDERMYCARVGPKKQFTFKNLVVALTLILGTDEIHELLQEVRDLAANCSYNVETVNRVIEELSVGTT